MTRTDRDGSGATVILSPVARRLRLDTRGAISRKVGDEPRDDFEGVNGRLTVAPIAFSPFVSARGAAVKSEIRWRRVENVPAAARIA
jgi:hypothetical protein